MNVTGSIIVRTKTRHVALDRWENVITDATWEGGPLAYVEKRLTHPVAYRIGATITVGPLYVRIIGYAAHRKAYIVARDTRWAWLYHWRYQFHTHISPIQSRVIATLAVWGLTRWTRDRR